MTTPFKPCGHCGKAITVKAPHMLAKRKTCSRACSAKLYEIPYEQQFWSKVDKDGPNGCWLWTASRKPNGYAQFNYKHRNSRAHRVAWKLVKGTIPEGMDLLHSCNVRHCVNPDHLRPGTHDENMVDKQRNGSGLKLTADQAREIRARFRRSSRRDHNAAELAAEYGVRKQMIFNIVTKRAWRHA